MLAAVITIIHRNSTFWPPVKQFANNNIYGMLAAVITIIHRNSTFWPPVKQFANNNIYGMTAISPSNCNASEKDSFLIQFIFCQLNQTQATAVHIYRRKAANQ
jgi:hypothetical protein